jgi:hypothetical protein
MAMSMKRAIFWDDDDDDGDITLMMEAVSSSEASVNVYQIT